MHPHSFDFKMDSDSFEAIASVAYNECGLKLDIEKKTMIQSRLRGRLKELGIPDFQTYSRLVNSSEGTNERRQMISALTTNVSNFFREKHHFDRLTQRILPALRSRVLSGHKLRIWSAGCSNGQEPYSIAMALSSFFPKIFELDVRILATDIDPKVVQFASVGRFPAKMLAGVDAAAVEQYFTLDECQAEPVFTVQNELRQLIRFKELNLLAKWPMQGQFDVVFCRNVVIYFDLETQNRLWPRFCSVINPGGHMFLGHSERISNPEAMGFASVGPTTYLKLPGIPAEI
jgi:chemotaxis protein methyltransferase CheR